MELRHFRPSDMRIPAFGPARLDFPVLIATLQAMQLATATARAESRCGGGGEQEDRLGGPLVQIVLGAPQWQDAVQVQGGSFNPCFARGADIG